AARHPDDERAGGRSRRCGGSAGVRREDGHRRDEEVGVRGGFATLAGARRDERERRPPRGGELAASHQALVSRLETFRAAPCTISADRSNLRARFRRYWPEANPCITM